IELYRSRFRPSPYLDRPYVMLGYNVFAADTDKEAHLLASSVQQAFVDLRRGTPTPLKPPVAGYLDTLPRAERTLLSQVLSCSAIGSPDTVRRALAAFVERTGADELILVSMIYDHTARLRSHQIATEVLGATSAASARGSAELLK